MRKHSIFLIWVVGLSLFLPACSASGGGGLDNGETDNSSSSSGTSTGGSSNEGNEASERVSFETIEKGTLSNIALAQNVVIHSQEDWEVLWRAHQVELVDLPNIDFTQKSIIGIFLGERSSGGYSIEIDQILLTKETGTISAIETMPGSNCLVTTALTYPYHLIAVAKTGKAFQFTIQSKLEDC